jgi:hypothetical protein
MVVGVHRNASTPPPQRCSIFGYLAPEGREDYPGQQQVPLLFEPQSRQGLLWPGHRQEACMPVPECTGNHAKWLLKLMTKDWL